MESGPLNTRKDTKGCRMKRLKVIKNRIQLEWFRDFRVFRGPIISWEGLAL